MNKSETIGSIAKALANFQAEIKNPKQTAINPYFKSKYAPLAEILDDCRPVLAKHGISVIQSNGGNGENITVTTLLLHSSGEWIESDPPPIKKDKMTPQDAGGAITYGRRYQLSSMLECSPTTCNKLQIHSFGNMFMPDYYPCSSARLVSCYALFK